MNNFINILNFCAYLLTSLGAMNWGLVVFFKFNLVDLIFRPFERFNLKNLFYALVALSGFYTLLMLFRFI